MTKVKERRLALQLRLQGKSYSQIKKHLKLSKSTLTRWLKDYPLTKEQIDALRGKNPQRIEKYRQTRLKTHQLRLQKVYDEEKLKWLPLSEKEIYLAGLFLYWGKGNKGFNAQFAINNTDPKVIKFLLYWLLESQKIPKEKIRVYLHLYRDMDVATEMRFWSEELKIPFSQFNRPYIKLSNKSGLDHKGFGHGTCTLVVNNVLYKERILMTIKAIADYYSALI